MSTEGMRTVQSFVASGDLSGLQYRVVDLLADNRVGHGVANKGFGVLLNKPQAAEHASVATRGRVKLRAGAAMTVGSLFVVSGSGWVTNFEGDVTDVGSAGAVLTTQYVLGRALTEAASGSLFEAEFYPQITHVLSA
jgi:hypothetical protein